MLAPPSLVQVDGKESEVRSFAATLVVVVGLLSLAGWLTGSETVRAQGSPDPRGQRAVVLGGGGVTGQAWKMGLLKGLRDGGIDLTQADLVVGTSAGSVVGAQMQSGQSLDSFYDALLAPPTIGYVLDPARVDLEYYRATFRMFAGIDTTVTQRVELGARA